MQSICHVSSLLVVPYISEDEGMSNNEHMKDHVITKAMADTLHLAFDQTCVKDTNIDENKHRRSTISINKIITNLYETCVSDERNMINKLRRVVAGNFVEPLPKETTPTWTTPEESLLMTHGEINAVDDIRPIARGNCKMKKSE